MCICFTTLWYNTQDFIFEFCTTRTNFQQQIYIYTQHVSRHVNAHILFLILPPKWSENGQS